MLLPLCLLWLVVYLYSIFSGFFKLKQIHCAMKVLSNYLHSAVLERSPYNAVGYCLVKKDNYQECLSDALYKFPLISRCSGYYCDRLDYGASDVQNYSTAVKLYNNLAMENNYLIDAFKTSFNPFRALKTLFSLPGLALSWFGMPQKISLSRLLNLLCWILVYLLNLYSDEIKLLLNSLIKNPV